MHGITDNQTRQCEQCSLLIATNKSIQTFQKEPPCKSGETRSNRNINHEKNSPKKRKNTISKTSLNVQYDENFRVKVRGLKVESRGRIQSSSFSSSEGFYSIYRYISRIVEFCMEEEFKSYWLWGKEFYLLLGPWEILIVRILGNTSKWSWAILLVSALSNTY